MSEYVKFVRCHHAHNDKLKKHLGEVGELESHSIERGESLVNFNTYHRWWIKDRYLLRVHEPTHNAES